MRKIFFYCDSTMNILTAYFISRIYYSDDYKILLISNNSSNSRLCVSRAQGLNIWNEVSCVYEFGKNREELIALGNNIAIEKDSIVHLFALNNRFAQILLNKTINLGAKFILTDEGYWTFNNFLQCIEKNSEFSWLDFDISELKIEAWAYEPQICRVPDYISPKRIELSDALKNTSLCLSMQEEVKKLFGIQDCHVPDIIYFDDYLSLRGSTAPQIEKYMLKLINCICSDYDCYFKKHPMERGWRSKYEDMELKFLPYENAPWEAIFFACMYNKMQNKDLILLTQSSTAVVNVILMFKVYNFKIILLHPLFEKLKKSNWWSGKEYFDSFINISEKNKDSIIIPRDLYDLVLKISDILHHSVDKIDILEKMQNIRETALEDAAEELNNLEHVLVQPLELVAVDETHQIYYNEHVLFAKEEQFEIEYVLNDEDYAATNRFEWKPNEKGRIYFKTLKIVGYTIDENEEIDLSDTIQNKNREDGVFLNEYLYRPNITFDGLNRVYKKIKITGEIIWDMSLEGVRTSYEEIYNRAVDYWIRKDKENSQQIENLNTSITQLEKNIKLYEEKLRKQEELIQQMKVSAEKDAEELKCIYDSLSWRITKPVRSLRKNFTKIKSEPEKK